MTNSDGGEHTIPTRKMTLRQTRLGTLFVWVFRKIFHGWLFCRQNGQSQRLLYTFCPIFCVLPFVSSFTALLLNNFKKITCITKRGAKVFVNYTGFTLSCGFYGYARNVLLWRGRLQLSIARPG